MDSTCKNDQTSSTQFGKPKNRSGRKRKRCSSESSSDTDDVLPENTLEVEKNIHASAIKNNLDDASVKKILKKVVTNDHVLALVKLKEEEEDLRPEEPNVKPKLTRAKAKELKKVSPNGAPWNLENLQLKPIKHIPVKTRPEVKALIAQELPEDEDDEEYQPTNDDVPSDDEHGMESCSDLESQPHTPATHVAADRSSPRVIKDGPFKLPQEATPARRKLEMKEAEATIALRTRSKLSLSSIPLEHIESSFVPPDELPPDIDHLWNEFLTDCLNPGLSSKNEDDDEADPEYNVAADPDANEEEELENSIIKISKKELNDLVTELFNIMPDGTPEPVPNYLESNNGAAFNSNMNDLSNQWKGKQEPKTKDDQINQTVTSNTEVNYRNQFSYQVDMMKTEINYNDTTINHQTGVTNIQTSNTDDSLNQAQATNTNEKLNEHTEITSIKANDTNEMSTYNTHETLNSQLDTTNNTDETITPRVNSLIIGATEFSIHKPETDTQHGQNSQNVVEEAKDQNADPSVATENIRQCINKETRKLRNKELAVCIRVKERRIAAKRPSSPPPAPELISVVQKMNDCDLEIHITKPIQILPQQLLIMQQQLRQHIQLAACNFLQLCIHPIHWSSAPKYKEYLECLNKMVEENSRSVANVCNLKPALELVKTWESSVSKNTPENAKMVEFIQNDIDRCRRNVSSNKLYIGNFHPTFMKVVANSSVFLYPYLLPAMPYRHEPSRRFSYIRSEDELITLGLDQFWKYVESNPKLYPTPVRHHSRQRWGIAAVVELISKHMMPWHPARALLTHIHHVRRLGDKNNPIKKYFEKQELTPMQHQLLPFNPELTLYEQPEHEMPRIWVRYLAKTSKRFREYLRRRTVVTGFKPTGVAVEMNKEIELPKKTALPLQFTKPIPSYKSHILEPKPKVDLTDRIGLNIDNSSAVTMTTPIAAPTNLYSVVQTSTGAFLVPLAVVQTTDTAQAPISSAVEINNCVTVSTNVIENTDSSSTTNVAEPNTEIEEASKNTADEDTDLIRKLKLDIEQTNTKEHCKCCMLIRKICKQRQTIITEYFKPNNKNKICPCKEIKKYPRVTNRLRLLLNSYKNTAQCVYKKLTSNLGDDNIEDNTLDKQNEMQWGTNDNDLAFVNAYQIKLNLRMSVARNSYIKRRVYRLFNRFEPETQDPLGLAVELEKAFDSELVDIYKETLAFFTPEQADKLDKFIDYFIHNCMEDVIKKVHEHVHDVKMRHLIMAKLASILADRVSTPCELCTNLILLMAEYPVLARYVFSLFPHRRKDGSNKNSTSMIQSTSFQNESSRCVNNSVTNPQAEQPASPLNEASVQKGASQVVENDAVEHLSSDGEKIDSDTAVQGQANENQTIYIENLNQVQTENTTGGNIIDTPELTITKTEVQDYESDTPMIIVLDDSPIKTEASEWSREDDKVLLETLKQNLTPEERIQKSVLELIQDAHILNIISETLTNKSMSDIRERLFYLLKLLVNGNK